MRVIYYIEGEEDSGNGPGWFDRYTDDKSETHSDCWKHVTKCTKGVFLTDEEYNALIAKD